MDLSASVDSTVVRGETTVPLHRFEQAIDLIMSPLEADADAWRGELTNTLRSFMDADRALMIVWQQGPPSYYGAGLPEQLIRDYLEHFAPLDRGMARRDELNLTVWSRNLLWDRQALLRSVYFHEFALPHDIQDAVGLSLDMNGIPAHLRMAFLYGGAPLPEHRVETMLRRLSFIVPVLRTGFALHLRNQKWVGTINSMIDRVGQRLILYGLDGRELHRNVTMRRTLAEEPEGEQLLEAAESVARALVSSAQRHAVETPGLLATPADSRRDVQTRTARYRLRACRIGPNGAGGDSGVLVSVDRVGIEAPPAEKLRKRYGLTSREAQVARLLAQRLTNDEIAATLGISSHTARHHTESVLLKLGVKSRRALGQVLAS